MAHQSINPAVDLPSYFTKLSTLYPRSTGNVTKNLFTQLLPKIIPTIESTSLIHDNASGPATATSALLANSDVKTKNPQIVCTDMVQAMITAVEELYQENDWKKISTKIMKSDEKFEFEDETFTHSVTNFSIFNFADRVAAMSEVYRTLKPNGHVVVTTWKRWGAGEIIHIVQKSIRPDLPLMKFSGPDMYDGVAVRDVMVKGGFAESRLEISEGVQDVNGEDLEGLVGFLKGKFCEGAMVGWEEEDKSKWCREVDRAVEEDIKAFGGLRFEMWAIIGRK